MNYYVKMNQRKICQPDLHIGKSSVGWEFNFQGYEKDEYFNTPELKSKQKWLEYLFLEHENNIYNEEDEHIPFRDFCELIENKSPGGIHKPTGEPLKNHYDECMEKDGKCDHSFKDEEGFNISMTEFS